MFLMDSSVVCKINILIEQFIRRIRPLEYHILSIMHQEDWMNLCVQPVPHRRFISYVYCSLLLLLLFFRGKK